LSPSRPHIQDSRLESSPWLHISSTTFDTLRANSGQTLSSESLQDEVGEKLRFQRQPSLSTLLSPPSRATEELVCLLGDVDGKLRAGATVQLRDQNHLSSLRVDPPISSQTPINTTTLERAKLRPRVELNLRLAGDTIVQGQSISGHLVVHVRDYSRAELPVLLANNKLRVVGFEYLADSPTFHVFFHYSCSFNELSYASEQIFLESHDYADEEGYREARKGLHVLPFEMMLPVDSCFGKPKGVVEVPGGATVRYIIMTCVLHVSSDSMLIMIMCSSSVNIKDSNTDRLSLAHFYRSCTIWPSLSLQEVLVPSTRPLVSTAVMSLSYRGSCNKLKLSARVPRPSYFSGQRCYVHIQISNDTRKIVRSLHLTLIRTTTVYRPRSGSRSRGEHSNGHISSNYRAKAFVNEISESRLVMSERTTRRCVSSRGWWAGVNPHEKMALTHRIQIPVRPYSDICRPAGSF
jgi:Arrestin (or S-antigen), C-terminal domain